MMLKKTHNKEIEILERALEAFKELIGLDFTIEGREVDIDDNRKMDVILSLKVDGKVIRYVVEIKKFLTPDKLLMVINQLNQFPQKGIIVTDYINPNLADRLRELNIPFIDIAGNAYINEPPVYVFVKGNRPIEVVAKKQKTRAFQPTGLKVLFAFLCQPELVNAPYRDVAKKAKVALGTVGWVIGDLKEAGFLFEIGKRGRKFLNRRKLLDRWVEAYPENLRPKLIIGRFQADENEWWKFTQIRDFNAYWGGEVAAAKITQYLKPQIATVYIKNDPAKLLLHNKLAKKPNGNVEILKAFWEIEYNWPYKELVPPLLIYADLLATGDTRNIETAKIIYERELTRFIGED